MHLPEVPVVSLTVTGPADLEQKAADFEDRV
jgi:hypothetical protein